MERAQGGEIELGAPTGLRARRLEAGSDHYLIMSYPVPRFELPRMLTVSEADVVNGVLAGKSRSQIARERGSSPRTVANLLAQAFRKLQVRSRQELAARLRGAEGTPA